jgi:UPF0755 protein
MPDPLDPEKYHMLSPKSKKIIMIVSAVVVLVVLPIFGLAYYKVAVRRPAQADKELTFEVRGGQSVPEIATALAQVNAINSEFLFTFYTYVNRYDRSIQAGVYKIKAGTNVVDLVNLIQHGTNDVQITFVEGWRDEEVARAASAKFNKIDYNDFVGKARQYEGHLFPDTYSFRKDAQEDDIITSLRSTFDQKTASLLTPENLDKVGLSTDQAIIIASVVEREASKDSDRPVVAAILVKRFKEGMKLDADATVQYAVATNTFSACLLRSSTPCSWEEIDNFTWWPTSLTQANLDFDSPYNTRKYAGLPPTPICNPGLAALTAVVTAQPTDYLYYLTDKSGVTHFAKTIEEHNANVATYLN